MNQIGFYQLGNTYRNMKLIRNIYLSNFEFYRAIEIIPSINLKEMLLQEIKELVTC